MRPRRLLLVLLSAGSLLLLAYGGVMAAFSVPITAEMEAQGRLPDQTQPRKGQIALVVPFFFDPTEVATLADPKGHSMLGYPGALLLLGEARGAFPRNAAETSLVRAIAYVPAAGNGTYAEPALLLTDVPHATENGTETRNFTVNLSELANGKAGFLVKADREANVTFIEPSRIVGEVTRLDSQLSLYSMLGIGGVGFVAPIVILIVTHRPTGRKLPPGAALTACPECGGAVAAGVDFCTRCGAWLRGKPEGDNA